MNTSVRKKSKCVSSINWETDTIRSRTIIYVRVTGCYLQATRCSLYTWTHTAHLGWYFVIFFQCLEKIFRQRSNVFVWRDLLQIVQHGQNHSTDRYLTSPSMYTHNDGPFGLLTYLRPKSLSTSNIKCYLCIHLTFFLYNAHHFADGHAVNLAAAATATATTTTATVRFVFKCPGITSNKKGIYIYTMWGKKTAPNYFSDNFVKPR